MEEQTLFEIIHNMDKFTNDMIIQWNKTFSEDLGISHVLVLGHLKRKGKSRPSDLAKLLGLTPATLSYLSEKLVAKQLAFRIVDEKDRRIVYLDITDKGVDVFNKASLEGQRLRANLFAKLTDQERTQLVYLFEKLNREE